MRNIKAENNYEKRNKLIRYGLGRGFNMDDIISCLDQLMKKE